MKVAITGYNSCCFNYSGGVQVRIKKIYELLSQREDIDVEYFHPMETDINSIDVLHLFKLEPEYFSLVKKAKSKGVKIVISSIVPLNSGFKIDLYRYIINKLPILTSYKMLFNILSLVDKIIVETHEELNFIAKHFGVKSQKMAIIPNGIDEMAYEGEEIYEIIGGKKDYVLHVGRIDANKNQLSLIKALKNTNIDVVFIGGDDSGNYSYVNKCLDLVEGDPYFHFLGWIDSKSVILKSAYSKAKVFAFPSYQETFGLALLEAAVSGCNIALSNTLPIHDFHVFDDAYLFNPRDVDDIRSKVLTAFNAPLNKNIKESVIKTFSWGKVIDEHIKIYSRLYEIKK